MHNRKESWTQIGLVISAICGCLGLLCGLGVKPAFFCDYNKLPEKFQEAWRPHTNPLNPLEQPGGTRLNYTYETRLGVVYKK